MIRFEQVGKRYPGGIAALAELTFAVESGEMVILSGHSGAGKSTLLKLIPAIERPTQGAVVVNGQNVAALKRAAIPFLRRNIGMIFQDQKLLYDRSAFDNVMLPLAIAGVATRDAGRRVRAALDKVGLLEREKAMPVALSGGEQQRLAIARAVVARPSILIADEPTAHLDDDTARDIATTFHAFNQVGVTVLVATHHESLFAPFMTRRITLAHGRLLP
ncbi:MAG: cell division ATP-binding protein FtsE [Rhodocyclales bacterium]|jgi:cell division transport system ATP-binding protein|nr:MAG: cell division ATP-binding protein FtsE [Rhodocyclales bacterium]GIK24296.1 MAG: cell division protein FtsE [Betaproteobacteria bacterium]